MATAQQADHRRVEYMPLSAIARAERNPKQHDEGGIRASLARWGVADLPVLDERTGRLVSGHGRLDQVAYLAQLSPAELAELVGRAGPPNGIQVDPATGEWLLPVARGWASTTDAEAEAYLLAANQLTIAGGWDETSLGALLADLAEVDASLLDLTGFDEDELAALLATDDDGPGEGDGGGGGSDDAPEPPPDPVSVLGDVWLLGRHRVMCGDSLNPQHLDRALAGQVPGIVYTDPPYGISVVNSNGQIGTSDHIHLDRQRGKIGDRHGAKLGSTAHGAGTFVATTPYLPVAGDGTTQTAGDAFRLLAAAYPDALHVWWGGNHYAASAGLPDSRCWLVWDKENSTTDFADCEMAWTNHPGSARLLRHQWHGMIRASERGKRVHPTQKPVALARWAFGVVDPKREAQVVLDAFGGSGSTLIAAHETDRTAVVLELEPAYVDVICTRYQRLTGELPILEATGKEHDFAEEADPGALSDDAGGEG